MIIFGTTAITMNKDSGHFYCPQCGPDNEFRHKNVRCFFTLYFIPLIPLHSLGEYIECQRCQGTFNTNVLEYDPAETQRQEEAIFMVAAKQVMIAMLLADGIVDDSEIKELQATFEDLAGMEVTEQDLREEIALVQENNVNTLELVEKFGPSLNDKGKEILLTAAYQIAAADGYIDPSEMELMRKIGGILQLSRAHLNGLLAELESPTQVEPKKLTTN